MEELETSKEELQSMNEELQTVNQENRHKVEELAQLTSDLQSLMAATDIATLFLDRELRIVRFTPRVGQLFSVRPADRGRPLSDLTHRLGYNELQADAESVVQRLIPVEREVQDDAGRWYLTRVLPYRKADDHIAGVVITFVDITTRRQAEEDLRASEEKYRILVEGAREYAILMLDPENRITSWSAGAERIFGYTEAEIRGQSGAIIFTEEDRAVGAPEAEIDTATRDGQATDDRWHLRKDGSRFWASGVMTALYHPDGSLRGFAKVLRDNTQRKAAEEALRESERRFRDMAETVPDVLFTMTADGVVDYVNRQHRALTGAPPEDVLGTIMWPQLIHPDDRERAAAAWAEVFAHGRMFEIRYRLHNPNESYCWVMVRARPIRGGDGSILMWYGTITDIDALTEAEEALQELNATLEQRVEERTQQVREMVSQLTMAEQAERRRISQILHDDLQQLLYGIEIKMGMIRRTLEQQGQDELAQSVGEARSWIEQAFSTTRQLTVDLSPPILQNEGLTDALAWLQHQMQELHGLDVSVEAEQRFYMPDEDLRVLLFQIVRELLFNVKKHARTDRVTVRLVEEQGTLVVHVIDAGQGFDADAAASHQESAGGFGLFSVRERLRLLGGHLVVRTRPGQGTHIEVHAPPGTATPTPDDP